MYTASKTPVTLKSLGIDPSDATIVMLPNTTARVVITRDKRVFSMRTGRQYAIACPRSLSIRFCISSEIRFIALIDYWTVAFALDREYYSIASKDKCDLQKLGAPGLAVTRDGRFWDLIDLTWRKPRWLKRTKLGDKYLVTWSRGRTVNAIVLYARAFVPNPKAFPSACFVEPGNDRLSPDNVAWVPYVQPATRRSKMGDAVAVQICTDVIVHGKSRAEVARLHDVNESAVGAILIGKSYARSTLAIRALRTAEFDRIPETDRIDLEPHGLPGVFLTINGRVWNSVLQIWQTPYPHNKTAYIQRIIKARMVQLNAVQIWAERWLPNPNGWPYAQFVDQTNPVFSTTTIHWVRTVWGDTTDTLRGRKLQDQTIRDIRTAAAKHEPGSYIAQRLGLSISIVSAVIHRRTYRDVK